MPLQDHFHPPLSVGRFWHSFHNSWATYISSDLNQRLPKGYFAAANLQFGIEIDVATFEGVGERQGRPDSGWAGGWSPPRPALTVPLVVQTDVVEIQVFNTSGGPILAGAVELVSPPNKDRAAHRDAFVSKCAAYLQRGVGLVVVDVVTERRANLHAELLARLGTSEAEILDADLYATAYRPVQREGQVSLDIWQEALAVGRALPTMPLWLPGELCLAVALEATYDRTCREQRVTANGD